MALFGRGEEATVFLWWFLWPREGHGCRKVFCQVVCRFLGSWPESRLFLVLSWSAPAGISGSPAHSAPILGFRRKRKLREFTAGHFLGPEVPSQSLFSLFRDYDIDDS